MCGRARERRGHRLGGSRREDGVSEARGTGSAKANARWALFCCGAQGDAPPPVTNTRKPPFQLRSCVERDDVKRGGPRPRTPCTRPGPARVSAALVLRSKRGGVVDDARDARALETFRATKVAFCRGAASRTARKPADTFPGFPHADGVEALIDLLGAVASEDAHRRNERPLARNC